MQIGRNAATEILCKKKINKQLQGNVFPTVQCLENKCTVIKATYRYNGNKPFPVLKGNLLMQPFIPFKIDAQNSMSF